MSLLQFHEVEKIYKVKSIETRALRGISFEIEKGEFTAIVGPSGSGKTTVLNIAGALDIPTSGKVTLNGIDYSKMSKSQLAELRLYKIGFVFQAYNLIPVLTALENAEFIMMLQGIPFKKRREIAISLMREVGIEDLINKKPDEMSGGQQQRVAVVRAIASSPDIVLADEPTANLDSHTTEELMRLMRRLNEERGITFLYATHDPLAMKYARRILHIRDGKLERDERN